MLSGIVRIRRNPLTAQTNASAMPVLPEGRFDEDGLRSDGAARLAGLDHGAADAVFDRGQGIEELALADQHRLAPRVRGQAVETDHGCRADGIEDAVVDSAAKIRLVGVGPGFVHGAI